ncbi:LOW QUALITY PROTEIN: netrin receptor unc-5-like [Leguminivora glycinivorella]|uniref:LOW QUALITY PROTEIN: netrin receptor unc-5-like n=1 Tax=Leguminivora glycinivorella TaxID=1035111 RepID=UPI00200E934B|nr:LOW QUALITY PROTEIN: netrin receptor unc-5-like [Leguminivora glycinivorella]
MCSERSVLCFLLLFIVMSVGKEKNGDIQHTTEKETRPEYIHPDGLLTFDPYLSDIKPEAEDDDYIPLPENDETIDGLPIFLIEPKNAYVMRSKPASLLCRAANALEVFFKCNDARSDKTVQFEHVDPQNGVRVVEAELNVTKNEIDDYYGGKFGCECLAWNSKGRIRSQAVFIEYAYIKRQFVQHPQSATIEAGHSVTLRCVPPLAAPPVELKWTRNGVPLDVKENTLQLTNIGLQDMANYTCVAENIAGRRESDVAVISVYVNGGWSEWSPWLPCRCGTATSGRRRTRTCTEPAPANGGAPCRGQQSQNDEDCLTCQNGAWSAWGGWSSCSEDCMRVRRRQCISGLVSTCSGTSLQHAACVDGLCSTGMRLSKNNLSLYIGIGMTVVILVVAAALFYVWCRYRNSRPGYIAARSGIPKTYPTRDKAVSGPDVTRSCNEYWMQGPDNHYDMPHVRDSYSSPFGNRTRQPSSAGSNHYEMKPYSPSGDSASSCYTNSRTMTSRSSEGSSQLAELVTSSPSSAKVDVAVTLPAVPLDSSYREKICLTVVK